MAMLDNLVSKRELSPWLFALAALGFVIIYQTAAIIYHIFFHPLAHFPGPFTHRISRLPWAILHATGHQAFRTQRLHAAYGPIVRIGPNHLSFTSPQAWKDIYGNPTNRELPKAPQFTRPVRGLPSTILNADGEEHTRIRRALAHGFSDGSMRAQEGLITKYVTLLVERLREESGRQQQWQQQGGEEKEDGGAQNMAAWYNWTTFDLASDLVFGESFHCLETVNYHPWVAYIMRSIKFHAVILALGYVGLGGLVQMIHKLGGFLALGKIQEYTNGMLRSRLGMGKGRNDLFEGLAKRKEEWEKLSRNATILLLAGSETTATTLSGATYFLLSHPHILERLKHEIRTAFSSPDKISISSVSKLPYMLAVLNETLRCYPPLTAGMVRVVPPEGAEIAGQYVPQGTLVEVQHWSVNHSDDNWNDPWVFRPERFMVDAKEALANGDKLDAVQAFSTGPRNCIGRKYVDPTPSFSPTLFLCNWEMFSQNFTPSNAHRALAEMWLSLAYTEMRLILAHIIYAFDMELADGSKEWIERQRAFNVWDRGPLNVRLFAAGSRK